MKIAFGCDHRGFLLKDAILSYLKENGHKIVDCGTWSTDRTDYPIYGEKVGRLVASGECDLGVLTCGTGFGISMAANQVHGIRAVCCSDIYTAEFTRRHNNANVIAVGACVCGAEYAIKLIDKFINTGFDGGRHLPRVNMYEEIRLRNDPVTGKEVGVNVYGKPYRFLNQRSADWKHIYEYQGSGATMTQAGCGIFSACHAVEYFCGKRIDPEQLADFSCSVGGRGPDGTRRPYLLKGMVEAGLDRKYGFRYDAGHINFDVTEGHVNDHEALWDCLTNGGCALCNLRKGHIVTLIGARVAPDGEKQVLAMDCHSESADERVLNNVREVLPQSEIRYPVYNDKGLMTGVMSAYGIFWVSLDTPFDFDLLYKRG